MVTAGILDYIKGQIALGENPDLIRLSLAAKGWKETDIEDAFSQAGIINNPSQISITTITSWKITRKPYGR